MKHVTTRLVTRLGILLSLPVALCLAIPIDYGEPSVSSLADWEVTYWY